jgi:sulfite exporter TauE/SafE
MTETTWIVAAALTFAASIHCVGMCGGFVLAVGAFRRTGRWRLLVDQLLLQLGKATSYAFLGTLAGAFGARLVASPAFGLSGRLLAFLAALAMALAGLTLLGMRPGQSRAGGVGAIGARFADLTSRLLGPLLSARPPGGSLVVGMVMGFLPCPLVYAGLAGAAASGSPARGAAILAGVALGTLPALAAVAVFGAGLPTRWRFGLARAAGVLLLVVAAVTLTRGLGLHAGHQGHSGHAMPAPAASDGAQRCDETTSPAAPAEGEPHH